MKRIVLLFISIWIAFAAYGEDNHKKERHPDDRKINVGIRGGFNSSMFLVSDLKIKDVTIDEIQNNYKISRCEISFDKLGSQHPDIEPDYASVSSTIHSIDFPLLYGYHVVKQGPYTMSLFAGPKLRYLWNKKNKITFENFDQQGIHEKLYPFNVSAVIGVSVNISRIFFDFRYEQGLHNLSKSVTYDNIDMEGRPEVSNITFRRRDNVLSFSLGVIF